MQDSITVSVNPYPKFVHAIKKTYDCWSRPEVHLSYTSQSNDFDDVWDLGDGTRSTNSDFIYDYKQDGTYNIAVEPSNEYCTYRVSQSLDMATVAIPNVTTPNNDDKNNFFVIRAGSSVCLQIFNRWGKMVYKDEDYSNTWNAEGLDAGVYYYVAGIKDETTCKGWTHVLK